MKMQTDMNFIEFRRQNMNLQLFARKKEKEMEEQRTSEIGRASCRERV